MKSHYDPLDNTKWGVKVGYLDLIPMYATIKKCDSIDEWGLMASIKLDLAKHIKLISDNKQWLDNQLNSGKISPSLLVEIFNVALCEHSKAIINGPYKHLFFHGEEEEMAS